MLASGVEVSEECQKGYKEMKMKHKQRCIVYEIKDEKEFVMHKFDRGEDQKRDFEDILSKLDGSGDPSLNITVPCAMVWDLSVPSVNKVEKESLLFLKVCPDSVTTKKKMLFAASVGALQLSLGIAKAVAISSMEDLNYENVLSLMK